MGGRDGAKPWPIEADLGEQWNAGARGFHGVAMAKFGHGTTPSKAAMAANAA